MSSFTIRNPIINSPFSAPSHHYAFNTDGFPTGIAEGRRPSSHRTAQTASFTSGIAQPRKTQKTLVSDLPEQERENTTINRIRAKVDAWRGLGYPKLGNPLTRELLDYWRNPERERRLFFCQMEALETLIYIAEVAKATGDEWIEAYLREAGAAAHTPLFRLATKMATGSGKTVVMAMIIAWQTLNRCRYPNDARFSDSFLLVAPNITIRDRLRVLLPSDPQNYYRQLDIVPIEHRANLGSAKIVITNFHAFKLKEKGEAGKLTKAILTARQTSSAFTESPAQMARRVCREFGRRKGIIVLNDEAHHCYRSRPLPEGEKLTGEARKEADAREQEARLWITGLEAIDKKIGVKTVYDLSATPFYLSGSGYPEGALFPWVVSDFSLMDAIESGIVKTPRVPTSQNAIGGGMPMFRDLWQHVAAGLPKKAKGDGGTTGPPVLPKELQAALHALYYHYAEKYREWEAVDGKSDGDPPPVFIVVCNNTGVSKMVFDYIGGHETGRVHPDGSPVVAAGELELFNNAADSRWLPSPNTILVDSAQLESEDGLSDEFKRIAAAQIAEFQAEYRARSGGDGNDPTDAELMREVLNTVGKPGKLGAGIRCVVSVAMLTEGWDANTVTHILGVRAFGSTLLQEQVVGRGLRRRSYTLNNDGHFDPEYADVYGIPFRFLPVVGDGDSPAPTARNRPGNVHAEPTRLALRPWLEIVYPRVAAYQYEMPPDKLTATFSAESRLLLSVADLATKVLVEPIVGESVVMTIDRLKAKRMQEVEFVIARLVAGKFAPPDPSGDTESYGVFAQLLPIVRRWIKECLVQGDYVFPQMLWLSEYRHSAAEKIHRAIRTESGGEPTIRAVLQTDDPYGTTALVSFDTVKVRHHTDVAKCHINAVPCDSDWEACFVPILEDESELPQVRAYVKNQSLGFRIPYTHEGKPRNYYPDYIVKIDDGHGPDDLLHLIVEISGQDRADKQAKADTATNTWIPAVNALGTAGRWAYVELHDADRMIGDLKKFLKAFAKRKHPEAA